MDREPFALPPIPTDPGAMLPPFDFSGDPFCAVRWRAPGDRVVHRCADTRGHDFDTVHRCACGAETTTYELFSTRVIGPLRDTFEQLIASTRETARSLGAMNVKPLARRLRRSVTGFRVGRRPRM